MPRGMGMPARNSQGWRLGSGRTLWECGTGISAPGRKKKGGWRAEGMDHPEGSKPAQTGRFYSCFRKLLTENPGSVMQDWDLGISRKLSCTASAEKSSKISRRKDLPAGRVDRISANNHTGEAPAAAPGRWRQDHGMVEWDLKPISSGSPPCQDIPMVQRELGINPAEHCSIPPAQIPSATRKGKAGSASCFQSKPVLVWEIPAKAIPYLWTANNSLVL